MPAKVGRLQLERLAVLEMRALPITVAAARWLPCDTAFLRCKLDIAGGRHDQRDEIQTDQIDRVTKNGYGQLIRFLGRSLQSKHDHLVKYTNMHQLKFRYL